MEKGTNNFSRGIIVILIIFIAVLIVSTFLWGETKFSITNEIIVLILLLVVLALSEVFDNFSIGNLITAKKEKREKEIELKEAKTENRELRTQLINIVSNSITNRNMNIFGLSKDDWVQMAGVEQAESAAVEEKKEEEVVVENRRCVEDSRKRHKVYSEIEKIALERFCAQAKIPILSVVRKVKFSNQFIGIDPIMERNAVFDAYYKSLQEEIFMEVKMNFMPAAMNMYSLYYLLSKVYHYRKANQLYAKMVLILPDLPESYYKDRTNYGGKNVTASLQETFAPAIKNNLLEIVLIEITQNDLDTINREIEEQEKGG